MDLDQQQNGQPIAVNRVMPQAPMVQPLPPLPPADPFVPDNQAGMPVPPQAPVPTSPQKDKGPGLGIALKIILFLFIIVLVGGAGYGIYYWQHQKVVTADAKTAAALAVVPPPVYSQNVGVATPLSIDKQQVTTTLVLPANNNILQLVPTTGSPAALAAFYTESNNDLMARWVFNNLGSVKNPSSSIDTANQILVSAVSKWQAVADPAGVTYPDGTPSMTVAQKTAFVTNLKDKTVACIKDSTKGFTTADKVYNICYEPLRPQAASANWVVALNGYAEIKGSPVYLRGAITLPNSAIEHQNVLDGYIKALKLTTTTVKTLPN